MLYDVSEGNETLTVPISAGSQWSNG